MAKKYVNGYDSPRFIIRPNLIDEVVHDISSRHEFLIESYEEIATVDKYDTGAKEMKIHHYDYEWELSFASWTEKTDRLKILDVENALKRQEVVYLVPHTDYPWRYFDILIKPEKKPLGQTPHHGGIDVMANTLFRITFMNKWQMTDVSVADTNYLPVTTAVTEEEF